MHTLAKFSGKFYPKIKDKNACFNHGYSILLGSSNRTNRLEKEKKKACKLSRLSLEIYIFTCTDSENIPIFSI